MPRRALLFKSCARYWPQTELAVNSASAHNPEYDIHLVTDKVTAPGIYHHDDLGVDWLDVAKPAGLVRLLERGYDEVVCLDGDTYTYGPFLEVERELGSGASMLVIPHVTAALPLNEDLEPSMAQIARVGHYNAGFVAATPRALPFLRFWVEATRKFAALDPKNSLLAEQKALVYACDFDERARVFRHPGYNWAYWNATQRPLSRDSSGELLANGASLRIAHFSGLTKNLNANKMSRYQNRVRLEPDSLEYQLFADYQKLLVAGGGIEPPTPAL